MIELKKLLAEVTSKGASDIHLKVHNYPFIRVEGELTPLTEYGLLRTEDTAMLAKEILNPRQQEIFVRESEVDLSFGVKNVGRFRLAVFQQRGAVSMSFRIIPTAVANFESLNLPPILIEIIETLRGLVLVTGITGSGKTTTLAAMVRHLNESKSCHILTIEDPIEFLFEDDKAIISQREVANDTTNFASGLRSAMRQDPDVIMVGEMRDLETVRTALQAAQTGHLVLSTLHTTDAITTVDRIVSLFPVDQQRDVRIQLSSALNAVVSMRLIRSSISGRRLPAVEILRSTEQVQSLIIQPERTKEIRGAMEEGQSTYGMQTFDTSILKHYQNDVISAEDALKYATSPADLRLKMKGIVGASESV
ncbi:MAG TPA: PilT/PilU family type 4a pilus ATPase [Acidobacteriota bacterium]|nr:PilT/PilU family type 4a pilus ATPase [Acidobacteriota bacterium]